MKQKIIMAWSKCQVEIGDTGENDAFAASLINVGTIKNQTTQLTANDGDALTATATGGEVVAQENNEGTLQLVTTVMEPSDEFLEQLGIAKTVSGELRVKTHIVPGDKCVKLTPKNKGAKGIKAPCTRLKVAPAFGEQTGNELTLTFDIFKTTGISPTLKKKTADGWTDVSDGTPIDIVASEAELPADAPVNDIYGIDENYWYSKFTTSKALH